MGSESTLLDHHSQLLRGDSSPSRFATSRAFENSTQIVIPTLTVAQMREVDRIMVEDLNIGLIQMMENAGRTLAHHTRRMFLRGDARTRRVIVLAGSGGNGGGGIAAARRLANWGAEVSIVLGQAEADMDEVPGLQLAIANRIGIQVAGPDLVAGKLMDGCDVLIDALIGYSLRGAPREPIASLIQSANGSRVPIVALDVPSGLDADTGRAPGAVIRASSTLTLALPKAGLMQPEARAWVGDLYLADISVPPSVYRRLGLEVGPIFAEDDIVAVGATTPALGG